MELFPADDGHLSDAERKRVVKCIASVFMSRLDQLHSDCERYVRLDLGDATCEETTSEFEMARIRRRSCRGLCDVVRNTGPYVWMAAIEAMTEWFEEVPTMIFGEGENDSSGEK